MAINEWWLLAQTEIMEMAKRGVPGVFTYGFYDGWVPNYLFWIGITHNSFGRFYEVQSYGPDVNANLHAQRDADQPRMVPSESAAALHQMGTAQQHQHSGIRAAAGPEQGRPGPRAVSRELLAEEQALHRQGEERPDLCLAHPAAQRRKADAADMVNDLRRQGVEVHRATAAFKAGNVDVATGDYIIRARPALPHAGRHVLQRAELPAGQSAAL